MDNKLNEIRWKISFLRSEMLLTEDAIRKQVNRDLDCSEASMQLMAMRVELCRNLGDEARSGGVVCRRFEYLDAVFESDTCDNLGQVICAFQPPPGFRCGDDQLEHHQPGGC